MSKEYWTMKSGEKIDVDDMTESHLRNTLKLIIRKSRGQDNTKESYKGSENREPYCDDWMWRDHHY
tara:strand:+ start:1800 stop:1997 length:198 start_codon:yes stop_codon:yes gene_type:complete